jgi:glutathione synthase/RimK-type ligase-like ATP-grasp enzyme
MDELQNCDMPVVVRPSQHSRGQYFWVCDNMGDILEARDRCRALGLHGYISELIDKAAEYRVFVVQGRAVWVAQKIPADATQIAWNHTNGATFTNVRWGDWPLRAVRVAIEGFNLSGLDFGGVDVIVDHDGRPYIVEINSAATGDSPYRTECTARAFDYIVRNGKAHIPLIEERGGWRKFAHPCLSDEVLVP